MKHLKIVFIILLWVSISLSCDSDTTDNSPSDTLNPLESYEELNISYGSDSNQVFDLYLPANRTTATKTLVLVHGGGWTSGDKIEMNAYKAFIKDQMPGYAIVNLNYRLANADHPPYPMQINDISSVIHYLNDHKEHYTISDTIGFVGVSAGAHLALLWSYAFDTENQVHMVCSIVGPTNFTDPAYLNTTDLVLQEIIDTFGMDLSIPYLEEISPYHRVTASAPPTILFYGGQDPLIPTTQGTAMRDKLEELNVTHEFTLYIDEGHGWDGPNLFDTSAKLKVFIETYL